MVVAVKRVGTLIPPFSVGGVRLKRANILSELITFEDAGYEGDGALNVPDMDFLDDLEGFEDTTEPGEALPEIPKEDTWQIGSQELSAQAEVYDERDVDWSGVVRIDDFTPEGEFSIADFSRMMAEQSGKKQIRIAFLGGSYIGHL